LNIMKPRNLTDEFFAVLTPEAVCILLVA